MKKLLRISLLIGGVIGAIWVYFYLTPDHKVNPLSLVPQDAIYILETDKPLDNWELFSESKFWSFLSKHPSLREINEDANYLDSLIKSNRTILKYFGNEHFIMSAHMTISNDYDFLFAFDLDKAGKLNLIDLLAEKMLNENDFQVTQRVIENNQIIEIKDRATKEVLYLSQIHNYLICSYSAQLIEKSIKQYNEADLATSPYFTKVYEEVSERGLARFYLQFNQLDEFLGVYTLDKKGVINALSKSMAFSAFDLELDDNQLLIEGYTSLSEEASILSLLQKHGGGKLSFHNVLSRRTAYAQVMCFRDFDQFYVDVIDYRSKDKNDLQEYQNLKQRLENTLKLSLEDDLLSWIGDEVVVAHNLPSSLNIHDDDLIVALKMNDKEDAKQKLEKIQKQIKKRSPAKFKEMSFKGHKINYLEIKGFFKIFLGKTFDKITQPYYTIIEDFVIFSNSPKTLVALLEDYEDGNVLIKDEGYAGLLNELPTKVALFTYVNGALTYPVLKNYVNSASLHSYNENEEYFNYFKHLGLTLSPKNIGFENRLLIKFNEGKAKVPYTSGAHIDSLMDIYFIDVATKLRMMSDAQKFVLEEINRGTYYKYFYGTKDIQIKAETKKGELHGDYLEFYRNGKLKIEGKYRKGRKTGIWKYYDKNGKINDRDWEVL